MAGNAKTDRSGAGTNGDRFLRNGIGFLLMFLSVFWGLWSRAAGAQEGPVVRVAAAADLKDVLSGAIGAFTRKTGIGVRVSYGPSGLLFIQIGHRAPFDVFMSADSFYADRVAKEGLGIESGDVVYARGRLALYLSPGDPRAVSVFQLSRPEILRVSYANPRMAPYGKLALNCLKKSGVLDAVRAKTVVADNVAQVAQYLDTGAVDAGLLPYGMAKKLVHRNKGTVVSLPSSCTGRLYQKMIVLKRSRNRKSAVLFQNFLLGPEGQAFFKKAGYPFLSRSREGAGGRDAKSLSGPIVPVNSIR